jgi:hypothetical protein
VIVEQRITTEAFVQMTKTNIENMVTSITAGLKAQPRRETVAAEVCISLFVYVDTLIK